MEWVMSPYTSFSPCNTVLHLSFIHNEYTVATAFKHKCLFYRFVFSEFRLCYYPHRLHDFSRMLQDTFGNDFQQTIFADFKRLEDVETPGFYIHLVEKH